MFALTEIKGVGRRYANLVCKKADIDLNKRYVGFLQRRLSGLGILEGLETRMLGMRMDRGTCPVFSGNARSQD